MKIAAVLLILSVAGFPLQAIEFNDAENCRSISQDFRIRGVPAICADGKSEDELRLIYADLQRQNSRKAAEIKEKWRGSDRAWCALVKAGVSPDNPLYWPDLRACRKGPNPCPFTPAKPGRCPE